jgi:quercetin dioxygenase-like cupin family protein
MERPPRGATVCSMDGTRTAPGLPSLDGARLKWHLTAADTGGRMVRGEVWLAPWTPPHPEHRHGSERVELLAGAMELVVGGVAQVLRRGDVAHIPAGVAHSWGTAGPEELHFMFDLELNG